MSLYILVYGQKHIFSFTVCFKFAANMLPNLKHVWRNSCRAFQGYWGKVIWPLTTKIYLPKVVANLKRLHQSLPATVWPAVHSNVRASESRGKFGGNWERGGLMKRPHTPRVRQNEKLTCMAASRGDSLSVVHPYRSAEDVQCHLPTGLGRR